MKKVLLSIGTLATVATPLATTVACDESTVLIIAVSDGELTIAGFRMPEYNPNDVDEVEKYIDFMESIGEEIIGLSGKKDITQVTLDGWTSEYQPDGSYKSHRVETTIDIPTELAHMPASNLQEAFEQVSPVDTLSQGASLFSLLLSTALM